MDKLNSSNNPDLKHWLSRVQDVVGIDNSNPSKGLDSIQEKICALARKEKLPYNNDVLLEAKVRRCKAEAAISELKPTHRKILEEM